MPLGSGRQDSDDTWKISVQIPLTHEEVGTVAVPQLLPVRELVKLIKYDRAEPSKPLDIWNEV